MTLLQDIHPPALDAPSPNPTLVDAPALAAAPPVARVPVDVFIPTYNERANIGHAIRSVVGWANRVFVLDSGSTDGTQELARELGAEVVEHPWEGYARQKNWGLDHLPFGSPWVFILDADEAITPSLREELTELCQRPPDEVEEAGFYVNRYLLFMGKRIRHCGYFPSWNLRLFKRGAARYEDRPVHEHMVLQGKEGFLRGLMSHEDRRGLEYYIAKHNRYSTLEAETIFFGRRNGHAAVKPRLFGNAIERRRFFKHNIYPKLPARWLGRFVWMYFINLGFLDGGAGLRFCLFISSHELFTSLKLRELQLRAKRLTADPPPAETNSVQLIDHLIRPPGSQLSHAAHESAPPAPPARPVATTSSPIETITRRERSPWTVGEKAGRVLWMLTRFFLFRPSFHNWYGWRRLLLRAFGAKIGRGVRVRPTAWVEIPWNLDLGDHVAVGDHAILYSLGKIHIGRLSTISQYAHLCAGTHDYTDPTFPLLRPPIHVGAEAWVAADAFIGPGVSVGDRAIVGARSTVMKDVPPDQVVAGNPAKCIKVRE